MQVRDIMTADPTCCSPSTGLGEIAQLMVAENCGEIPVCDEKGRLVGVVTDRDIACRIVAKGKNPLDFRAQDCMSSPVITTTPETTVEDCGRLMEQYQVRRLPVVDGGGGCCGIISQADIAMKGPRDTIVEVLEKVSEPNTFASSVGGR